MYSAYCIKWYCTESFDMMLLRVLNQNSGPRPSAYTREFPKLTCVGTGPWPHRVSRQWGFRAQALVFLWSRHWGFRAQALVFLWSWHWGFSGAGIGVFAAAALVFLGAGIGVFVVAALGFLRSWHWCFCGRGIGARRPP